MLCDSWLMLWSAIDLTIVDLYSTSRWGGSPGTRAPSRSYYFHFHFWGVGGDQILVGTLPSGLAPLPCLGYWIRHCISIITVSVASNFRMETGSYLIASNCVLISPEICLKKSIYGKQSGSV